jgi:hypothetical protein
MGQMTYGLLYGVEVPKGLDLHGDDDLYDDDELDESGGVFGRAEAHFKTEIESYNKDNPSKGRRDARGADLYVPDTNSEGKTHCMGFWVAIGATGKRGAPELSDLILSRPEETYGLEITAAKERWDRFAAWAKAEGIELPDAELRLVETEVA